jgi:hypothetical protein
MRSKEFYMQQQEPSEGKSTASIIPLQTSEGKDAIKAALDKSNGAAAIIVHPFFHESSNASSTDDFFAIDTDYANYTQRLKESVKKYKNLNLPLILFESETEMPNVESTLDRIGVRDGDVFVVPTGAATPEPTTQKLDNLSAQLKQNGLKRATVVGSYFWLGDIDSMTRFSPTTDMPFVVQNHALNGCVGYALEKLLEAEITATPGYAAYPRWI